MTFRLCFQLSITLCNKGGQISPKKDYVNGIKSWDWKILFVGCTVLTGKSHLVHSFEKLHPELCPLPYLGCLLAEIPAEISAEMARRSSFWLSPVRGCNTIALRIELNPEAVLLIVLAQNNSFSRNAREFDLCAHSQRDWTVSGMIWFVFLWIYLEFEPTGLNFELVLNEL